MKIPPIGMVVIRFFDGQTIRDSMALVRIGDEQNVLVWQNAGKNYDRVKESDIWQYESKNY